MARKKYSAEQIVTMLRQIEGWRKEYNTVRPHSALGQRPPAPIPPVPCP